MSVGDSGTHDHKIFRSTAIVGSFTGLSRVLGFIREILTAVFFGTTLAKSAFDIAFMVPNLLRSVFGEGALSAGFVPVFTQKMAKDGNQEANHLAGKIMTMLAVTLFTMVAAAIVLILVSRKFLCFGERWSFVAALLVIMLPYAFFICIVALCSGILNSYNRFWAAAATPGLLNIIWIGVLVCVCPWFGKTPEERIYAVAWGVIAAGAAQMLFQAPFLLKEGFRPAVSFAWKDPDVTAFLKLVGPAMLIMGVVPVNVLVSRFIALTAGDWAPAALGYAERLIYLPLGVFATALGSVLLPTFSHQAARSQNDRMIAMLNMSMRNISLLMVPMAALLFVLAMPFVSCVFEWKGGVFDSGSAVLTTRALQAYAPGLIVFSLYKVIVPAFYAVKDTKTPMMIAAFMVLFNLVLNVFSVLFLPAGFQHAGMAASNCVASLVNCAILLAVLNRRMSGFMIKDTLLGILKMCIAAVIVGVASWFIASWIMGWLAATALSPRLGQVAVLSATVVFGAGLYLGLLAVISPQDLKTVVSLVRRKEPAIRNQ